MKKLIFRNFSKDITYFFIITSLSLTLIVWVIQAVNYLDFVSEDGHSFGVYFMYSLLSLPKIFSKLILFVFFISVFFTLSKYEENNEILIFWTFGIKKSEFLNKIVQFSLIYFLISIILTVFLVPKTQDIAKSFIRESNIDYFPSLIKTQHFNDAASDLTIFVEEKDNKGFIKNIFIKDNSSENAQIISARRGIIAKKNELYYLILYNGNIVNLSKKNTNLIKFDKTEFNLSNYGTRSTIFPKIQETSSVKLINCLNIFFKDKTGYEQGKFRCNQGSIDAVFKETYKRLILPFYIILIGFITGCLVIKSKTRINFSRFKIFIFLCGFILIVFSEGSSNILNYFNFYKSSMVFIPFMLILLLYFTIIKNKKIQS